MVALLLAVVWNVVAEGADPTGAREASRDVNRVIEKAASGDTVFLPKGTYALDGNFRISNKQNLCLKGEDGTVIRMHCNPQGPESESSGAFCINESRGIRVAGFAVTTDNPVGTQGRIVACDVERHEIVMRPDKGYEPAGTEHFFQVNTTDEDGAPDGVVEGHEPIRPTTNAAGRVVWKGLDYQMLDKGLVRITVPKWCGLARVKPGQRMLVRYFRNGTAPVIISKSHDVRIENVAVERTLSCGAYVYPPSGDVLFDRFSIAPPKGSDALIASNADGIHVMGCANRIGLKDCTFRNLGDDAFNVHAMAGELTDYDAETGNFRLAVFSPDRKTERKLIAGWAAAGNEIEFYDPKTCLKKGSLSLVSYDERACTGVFARASFRPAPGDKCVNARDCPAVRIVGCTVENTRARAFLLQTRDVRIRDCMFRGFPSAAIVFSMDFAFWNEAGPPSDVEIRDCTFEKCATRPGSPPLGAVVVKANHDGKFGGQPAGVFRDVRLVGNVFSAIPTVGAYITSTIGVRLEKNDFSGCGGRGYEFLNCEDVEVDGTPVRSN